MTGDTWTMVRSNEDTWFTSPTTSPRELERAAARGRTPQIRGDLQGGEQFRRALLAHLTVLASLDVTDVERAETATWRHRVEEATASELWAEYQTRYLQAREE